MVLPGSMWHIVFFLKPSMDNCPEGELFSTWNCFPILGAEWLPGENSPSHKNNEEKDSCRKSCGHTFDQYMIYSKKEYLCCVNQMILGIPLDVSLEQNIWKPARPWKPQILEHNIQRKLIEFVEWVDGGVKVIVLHHVDKTSNRLALSPLDLLIPCHVRHRVRWSGTHRRLSYTIL